MVYTRKIVCLANSRKLEGYCFAGKEVLGKKFGKWIRPVSARDDEEISKTEQTFSDDSQPKLLDIVSIPMLKPQRMRHQQENHLIDDSQRWKRTGRVKKYALPELLDDTPGEIWINAGGKNDRIPVAAVRKLKGSLLLIKPESLTIIVQRTQLYKEGYLPQVRAVFGHNKHSYNLAVTDLIAEEKYRQKSRDYRIPEHPVAVDNVYLCVSLAEKEFQGNFYKLVAAIIGDET